MKKTILIIDNDVGVIELLKNQLEHTGFNVLTATTGNEALQSANTIPDLIALDIMIQDPDGWEVARQLKRERKTARIPIMFLTSKESVTDEVVGFELGAVDYIIKPFNVESLLARIRGILRNREEITRGESLFPEIISREGLNINVPNYSVTIDKEECDFPKKEFEVLAYLVTHSGRVITRQVLLHEIWGKEFNGTTRTVDVHIRKIREKLGKYDYHIETVKRVGYRFKE